MGVRVNIIRKEAVIERMIVFIIVVWINTLLSTTSVSGTTNGATRVTCSS
jgi:uncharacterized membrane protein YtjA (UPF0391 family)